MRTIVAALALATVPVQASAQGTDDVSVPELANQICDAMAMYRMTNIGPVHEAFELIMLDHLGFDEATPEFHSALTDFWNANHEQMICTEELPGLESPQHILKRVIDMRSLSSFFFEYFLIGRDKNVNAVEQTANGPETLLDHIDGILADPQPHHEYYVEEIRTLRDFLVEFMGGKRGAELSTD